MLPPDRVHGAGLARPGRARLARVLAAVAVVAAGVLGGAAPDRSVAAVPPGPRQVEVPGAVAVAEVPAAAGRYLVRLADATGPPAEVPAEAGLLLGRHGGRVGRTFGHALRGFSADLPAGAAQALAADAEVASVEPDGPVVLAAAGVQAGAPWNLDRIDQAALPLDGSFTYPSDGAGVAVHVVDTGIRTSHVDLGGRATVGTDVVGDGQGGIDCHGHGTQVAAIAGGTTWGVAKAADLVAVRVLDCAGAGSVSDLVAGLDWVAANATLPAVANVSLTLTGPSPAADAAVAGVVAAGVPVVAAAGNLAADACGVWPATSEAFVVGATTPTDAVSPVSNVGSCLDLFAPGDPAESADAASDTATAVGAGTSMAAAHAAGTAAVRLSRSRGDTPAEVAAHLVATATPDVVVDPGDGSPNLLLRLVTPEVTLAKAAAQSSIALGDPIDYTITVTNGGEVAATGIVLADPQAPGCAGPVPDLAVGEAHEVTCSATPTAVGPYANVATASADDALPATSPEVVTEVVEAPGVPLAAPPVAAATVALATGGWWWRGRRRHRRRGRGGGPPPARLTQ